MQMETMDLEVWNLNKESIKNIRTAIKQNDLELVKSLIEEDEELLNVDTVFGSWLHVASSNGKFKIVEYFIECGLDVNKNGDISGGTPVRSAASKGYLDIIKLLHQNGAVFEVSEATKNPLFGAICNGHYEVAKYLIDNGIDITAKYAIGKLDNVDAYEYARQFGQTKIADYIKDKFGNIPKDETYV